MEKYLCRFAHGEPYVSYKTMIEIMVRSTSSSSSVYGVEDDNNNPYNYIIMDATRLNQGYACKCSIIDEKLNEDATRLFYLLEASNKPL
jgi:hypothetical protein